MPARSDRDFWTRDAAARDIEIALRSGLSRSSSSLIINSAVWFWTERDPDNPRQRMKYRGCRYWSLEAINEQRRAEAVRDRARLCHEHVVPRAYIVGFIHGLPTPTAETVRRVLDELAVACIVTEQEDARLSKV